jgi:ATP-dependent Clp protease ATP-binding subunit ClpC
MQQGSGGIMKFCEALDRFVGIRTLNKEEQRQLFEGVKLSDRKSYTRLIINTAVVDFHREIAPLIFEKSEYPMLREVIEKELYDLCIKVNPGLDIREVSLPMASTSTDGGIAMLDGGDVDSPAVASGEDGDPIQVEAGSERYLRMAEELRAAVIGQDEAIEAVSAAIRKAKAGLKAPERPVGSFLFVGSTGVGKTETAKALNRFLYEKTAMVRIDCSEYAAPHEYSKLIGAPPGYIGHNDGGYLTEAMKNRPGAVVVFDEIEKAHLKVHNLLLQIMEEGILTDSKGALIPFKDSVVIMTSNVGVASLTDRASAIGFDRSGREISQKLRSQETRKALEKTFPPEFLNRIDEVVVFRNLDREDTFAILARMLQEVQGRTRSLGLEVHFEDSAREFLVEKGFDEKFGARPLRRAIHRYVENPLAERILSGELQRGNLLLARRGGKGSEETLVFDLKKP